MTIEEKLNDIEKGFKEFSENMDVFLDSFAESLYDLKKQIKAENKTPEPSGLWKPKEGEKYYYIDTNDMIIDTCFYGGDNNPDIEDEGISIGNCFRTQEEAEKALERLKIRRQLKDIAARLNKGREIDWKDGEQQKYYISYNAIAEMSAQYTNVLQKTPDVVYCLDDNFLGAAIAEIGEERLREYLKEC